MTAFFRFPRTPHLAWLGDGQPRDDKVLSPQEAQELLSHEVTVEEKVDGANLGFSVDEHGTLRAQTRGTYLSLEAPHGQWKPLKRWLAARASDLAEALFPDLMLFGEWCYAVHGIRSVHRDCSGCRREVRSVHRDCSGRGSDRRSVHRDCGVRRRDGRCAGRDCGVCRRDVRGAGRDCGGRRRKDPGQARGRGGYSGITKVKVQITTDCTGVSFVSMAGSKRSSWAFSMAASSRP